MGTQQRVIALFDRNNKFLRYITRQKAKQYVKEGKAKWVATKTLRMKYVKTLAGYNKSSIVKDAKSICYICNRKISDKNQVTIDHVIPISRDKNADVLYNMRCCCARCNADKGDKTLIEYVEYIRQNRESHLYISDKQLDHLVQYAPQYENAYKKYKEVVLSNGE